MVRRYNRRRRKSKRGFVKRRYTRWRTTRRLQRFARVYNKKKVMPEYKVHDVFAQLSNITDTTGLVVNLDMIAQGNKVNEREGNKIIAKSLYIRGTFKGAATISPITIRTIIFMSKHNESAAPTAAEILYAPAAATVAQSPVNLVYSNDYVIFYDKMCQLHPTVSDEKYFNSDTKTAVTYQKSSETDMDIHFKYYKKLNMVTKYINENGNIAACWNNHLHMLVLSDNTGGTPPAMDYHSRLRFIDT